MRKLKDFFYENELQKIHKTEDAIYRVENVIRRRNKGKDLFVKWVGWPVKFNSWIQTDQVQKLNV